MANRSIIGIAIFGLGRAGTIHLHNLIRNPRVSVLYIVEQDVLKAEQTIDSYRLSETEKLGVEQASKAYEDPRVDAVIVCTPTFEHESIVLSSLKHGKAVFCEKPISQSEDGVRNCYKQAEESGKPLFCSFNRRFDPSVASIRQRVQAGEIGSVQIAKTCSRDSPTPSAAYLAISGGIFHDCAVHDIDAICWILGDFPASVYTVAHAHNETVAQLGDVDSVIISMKFRSGVLAVIDLSRYAAYGYDQRVEIFGSEGMLVSENQRPTEVTSLTGSGTHRDVIKYSFPQRYAESYVNAMEHFLDVVEGKEEISVSMTSTLNVSAVALACEDSYHTGKPVELHITA